MSDRHPDEKSPEDHTQEEIREEAADEGEDPITRREGLETELIDEGDSDAGRTIGDEMP